MPESFVERVAQAWRMAAASRILAAFSFEGEERWALVFEARGYRVQANLVARLLEEDSRVKSAS